MFKNQSPVDVC